MIFYTMLAKNLLWGSSQDSDPKYSQYLKKRETGYPPFESQEPMQKELLYRMLDPEASKRPEAADILKESWMLSVKECMPPSDPNETTAYHHEHACH
jgi:serine/threonine protein kinase